MRINNKNMLAKDAIVHMNTTEKQPETLEICKTGNKRSSTYVFNFWFIIGLNENQFLETVIKIFLPHWQA